MGRGRAARMEIREQNLKTRGKWERKFPLAHLGENGRKEMSKGNRRGRKKTKARPGSPHSLKSEPGKCGEAYKGAMFFVFWFFFLSQASAVPICQGRVGMRSYGGRLRTVKAMHCPGMRTCRYSSRSKPPPNTISRKPTLFCICLH